MLFSIAGGAVKRVVGSWVLSNQATRYNETPSNWPAGMPISYSIAQAHMLVPRRWGDWNSGFCIHFNNRARNLPGCVKLNPWMYFPKKIIYKKLEITLLLTILLFSVRRKGRCCQWPHRWWPRDWGAWVPLAGQFEEKKKRIFRIIFYG